MSESKKRIFACDFETTVYEGQTDTQVWAASWSELYQEEAFVVGSIQSFFEYFFNLCKEGYSPVLYFHNLKFDGHFILWYLFSVLGFKNALSGKPPYVQFKKNKDMQNKEVKYTISDTGQWYTISIKVHNKIIDIRDSLKLLPFALRKLGKDFKTDHQKLDMKYEGFRYPDCPRTESEDEYIKNDVHVLREALQIMFEAGHDRLTIGACCLKEFQSDFGGKNSYDYRILFPDLKRIELVDKYGDANADAYIRHSYKGGWCYLSPEKAGVLFHKGLTGDVNSLYPSVMGKDLNYPYPVGNPHFWFGDYIPEKAKYKYYFIRIRCRFKIKKNKLPTIQIKGNILYDSTEWLTTSDVFNRRTHEYQEFYIDKDGVLHDTAVELTLTCTDFELFKDHYHIYELEVISGCWFYTRTATELFDNYISKYQEIKEHSTGAQRGIAKLFSNNLYGKLASNDLSSFKVAFLEDDVIQFYSVEEHEKPVGYIPIGSAVTSYARNFTIRTAQKNYKNFIYADTDSIHCSCDPDDLKGVNVHPTKYAHWKIEAVWDFAIFVRQKTYIEHVVQEDLKPCDPHHVIKCAGMPERCKQLLSYSFDTKVPEDEELNDEEHAFVEIPRTYEDFKVGLKVPSKLKSHRIRGGVLLESECYEMRPKMKKGIFT